MTATRDPGRFAKYSSEENIVGLLTSIFGSADSESLMRELGYYRFDVGPPPYERGSAGEYFEKAKRSELLTLPEGTVVTISETYLDLLKQGVAPAESLLRIEDHRKSIGRGRLPSPLTLENYVAYRIAIEHNKAAGISSEWLRLAVAFCRQRLNIYEENPGVPRQTRTLIIPVDYDDLATPVLAKGTAQPTQEQDEECVLGTVNDYLDGLITDEEFFERVDQPMQRINQRNGRKR